MTTQEFIAEWESGAPYIMAHTSGSTGTPKPVRLSRRLVEESARRSIAHFGLDAGSRLHLCLSPSYIAGKMLIVRSLMCGASLTCEEPGLSPLAENIDMREITLMSVVGAQLPGLLALRESGAPVPVIRHLLVGGAPLNAAQADMALRVAMNVWESYGMTETASHIALRRIDSASSLRTVPFTLLPGIAVELDARGCLVVDTGVGERLVTNDVAEMLTPRTFLILGRADNVIITGGLKVHPDQVEPLLAPLLAAYPGYFITGREHPRWGNVVCLVVESSGISVAERERIIKGAAELLPTHCRPREIVAVSKLKRTDTGKIIRRL